MNCRPLLAVTALSLLAACASAPTPQLQRADRLPGANSPGDGVRQEPLQDTLGDN